MALANAEVELAFIYVQSSYSCSKQLKMQRIYLRISTRIILKTQAALPHY